MVAAQLLFRLLHGAPQHILGPGGVIVQLAVLDLHIVDIPGAQPHHRVGQRQQHLAALPLEDPVDRPLDPDPEGDRTSGV